MIYSDDLKNKTVLILGGCGLIGKAITTNFAKNGSKILLLDNNLIEGKKLEAEIKKYNNESIFIKIDISKFNILEKNFLKILNKHHETSVFINASYPKDKDWKKNNFKQITFNSLRKNVDIHLNSYIYLSYIFCNFLKKNKKKGSVILISSIYGLVAQDKNLYKNTNINENFTYSIIKGGIENFNRQIAAYYGEYDIRINTISPGGVENLKKNKDKFNSKFKKNYIARNPIKRMCSPNDVANAAIYLSSESSSYVTGTSLVVDGGWTSL